MNYENEGIQEELSQTSIENEAERLIILEGREKCMFNAPKRVYTRIASLARDKRKTSFFGSSEAPHERGC